LSLRWLGTIAGSPSWHVGRRGGLAAWRPIPDQRARLDNRCEVAGSARFILEQRGASACLSLASSLFAARSQKHLPREATAGCMTVA